MTTAAFNSLLCDFVNDLASSFPEERGIAMLSGTLGSVCGVTPWVPSTMFLETFGPHAALIRARDPALFSIEDLEMGGYVDMSKLWADSTLSEESRAAIWQYLHALLSLATA
jgi:hypothetical protein